MTKLFAEAALATMSTGNNAKLPAGESNDDLVDMWVAERVSGLSRSTIYRKLADPNDDFPRPVPLSLRRRKFIRGELKTWRARRIADRVSKPI
jgi:predicted DNA-binding transcriptional regulator AlpA